MKSSSRNIEFFESKIRPILVQHCYECHSEQAGEQKGGLLLDRQSGWMEGGDTNKAVLPGNPDGSLMILAVRHADEDMIMPPKSKLQDREIQLLEEWVRRGAPGPKNDMGDTEFSQLGDQEVIFAKAENHWAFQPVKAVDPPAGSGTEIDRFIRARLRTKGMTPSRPADDRTLIRRLHYDLTGLPPTSEAVERFIASAAKHRGQAIESVVNELLESPAFGEHLGRLWLDVARYADTDSTYRPDTKTPYYFPFAFTYRDYVVSAFNADKPFDQFIREQFAADQLGLEENAPEMAALGFWAVGPHANRSQAESLDDWIDVTTRGLMGMTVACARCHDHKYEPIPTADYYSLRGVFAAVNRVNELDEEKQPISLAYHPSQTDTLDYQKQRAAIDEKIAAAEGKKAKGNNRSVAEKIRDTELAKLLTFHRGAPSHMMVVHDNKRIAEPFIFIRGDASQRGDTVPRRFLKILDSEQETFPKEASGRLQLAEKIVSPENPLTARVFVNRVWGYLLGSHLVSTPSDFGLQGASPSHPQLLDWLAADFIANHWSTKHLVKQIVLSQTYQQSSRHRDDIAALDSENRNLWRANRKRLPIEALRDSILSVAGNLDLTIGGRPEELWGETYTTRRAIYGFINRFNLDPTLRAFDFPTPMQTQPLRNESIVATQALFTLNSPFVIEQAKSIVQAKAFQTSPDNEAKLRHLFAVILQREPDHLELPRMLNFVERENRPLSWDLVAQGILMSNEFQYLD